MNTNLKTGTKVKLKSFHGTKLSNPNESYNFWLLVDSFGEIASEILKTHSAFPEKGQRALVKFEHNLEELGLPNHNEIPNTLWIFLTDLEFLDS